VPLVRTITNQVLVLGLDGLYRDAMKRHEAGELLQCARAVADCLGVFPAGVPVEGYYAETEPLREYFSLVRALQERPRNDRSTLSGSAEFERLESVTSAPLFGLPCPDQASLFPRRCDPLFFALRASVGAAHSIDKLASASRQYALSVDDISLVGLAALTGDAALIGALRESVVLYAEVATLGLWEEPHYQYVWDTDDVVRQRAERFVSEFNELLGDRLPLPNEANSQAYWDAHEENDAHGRCVCIAVDPTRSDSNYHWGIYRDPGGRYRVEDFWSDRLWTTSDYSGHQVFPLHRSSDEDT